MRSFLTIAIHLIAPVACIGCSSLKAPPAPLTPFLIHHEELHPWHEHAPWDVVWSSSPGHIMVQTPFVRKLYVAPVDTQFLNKKQNSAGEWTAETKLSDDDVKAMAEHMRQSFVDQIKNSKASNLEIVEQAGPDVLILSIALVELIPTKVSVNVIADVGAVVVPGSKAIEEAGVLGAQVAGGAYSGGSIAMEFKILDGSTGQVLAQAADRERDPGSVIPNYRDFEEYGWSRQTSIEWAKQFVAVFSTAADVNVEGLDQVSITPW